MDRLKRRNLLGRLMREALADEPGEAAQELAAGIERLNSTQAADVLNLVSKARGKREQPNRPRESSK